MRYKKHSSTSPDVQFKEFSLTKQKPELEWTMSELRKPIPKNQIKKTFKKTENQCRNAAYEQKPTSEKEQFVQTKNRPKRNYE